MERLIELLNEYEKETKKSEYSQWRDLLWGRPQYLRCDTVESELLIISKGYHFIKWLVENDKIDIFHLDNYIAFHNDYRFVANRELRDKNVDEDHLLMLLSISDTPIEDLLLYLK